MRLLPTTPLLVFVLLISGPLVHGQTATGEVNGTITDPNGAVMTGATAKLINQATNIDLRTQPNPSGYFTFVNSKPCRYLLRVEARGFKTAETSALVDCA